MKKKDKIQFSRTFAEQRPLDTVLCTTPSHKSHSFKESDAGRAI